MAGVGLEECLEQVSRGVAREHRMRQLERCWADPWLKCSEMM